MKKGKNVFQNPLVIFSAVVLISLLFFFSRQEPFTRPNPFARPEPFTCKQDGSGSILEDEEDISFNLSGTCQELQSMLMGSKIEDIQDMV
jgi:hypothetical protein